MSKEKSPIFVLTGGLGNQLFQLSAAIVAAHRRKQSFQLVVNDEKNTPDVTGLTDIQMNLKFADYGLATSQKNIERIGSYESDFNVYSERQIENSIISGYFQDTNIAFDAIGIKSRMAFLPKKFSNWYKDHYSNRSIPLITMHIRRGDYNASENSLGLLSPLYYKRVLDYLNYDNETPIRVFTDDPKQVKKEFKRFPYNIYIVDDTQARSPLEVLWLMGNTKILICGNSTFSIWAGILNYTERIFLPKPFFKSAPPPRFNCESFDYQDATWKHKNLFN